MMFAPQYIRPLTTPDQRTAVPSWSGDSPR
jgi:hypothetical protein